METTTWVTLTFANDPDTPSGIDLYVDTHSGKVLAEVSSALDRRGDTLIASSATLFDTRRSGDPVRVATYVDANSAKRAAEQMVWGDAKQVADKILHGESK
jgi:hypothetical protein